MKRIWDLQPQNLKVGSIISVEKTLNTNKIGTLTHIGNDGFFTVNWKDIGPGTYGWSIMGYWYLAERPHKITRLKCLANK